MWEEPVLPSFTSVAFFLLKLHLLPCTASEEEAGDLGYIPSNYGGLSSRMGGNRYKINITKKINSSWVVRDAV